MAYGKGGKLDWKGCQDSTPSSSTERNPADQPDRKSGGSMDWRGMGDGTPGATSDRDAQVRK